MSSAEGYCPEKVAEALYAMLGHLNQEPETIRCYVRIQGYCYDCFYTTAACECDSSESDNDDDCDT